MNNPTVVLKKENSRIMLYDVLRGIAISLMLMANSAAYVYTATPPLLMRLAGSLAAPSFMILAGMMLALAKKPRPARGYRIIAIGCLIDVVVWQIVPFVTFDVLYTIGAAIVISAYPARLFSVRTLWISAALFIVAGQALQWIFGYTHEIFEIALTTQDSLPPLKDALSRVLRQFFIDGWFPIFPWLGFVWLGAALQRNIQDQADGIVFKCIAVLSLVVSALYWASSFVAPETRQGYSELFYPPDVGFCFTAAGLFCIFLFLLQSTIHWKLLRFIATPFAWIGQYSLSIYVIHLIIIKYILSDRFATSKLDVFFYTMFILWGLMTVMARILIELRDRHIYGLK